MRPNLLLITADQWRGDCLGVLGHPHVVTPHLDALAEESVVFTRHFAPCAPCSPARASLYTGLYQMTHRVVSNGAPLDRRFDTVAQVALRSGTRPALFGYTDTALDPRGLVPDDPRLGNFEEVLPGFAAVQQLDEAEAPWRAWMASRGRGDAAHHRVAPEADQRVSLAPTAYGPDETQTAFLTDRFLEWLPAQPEPWAAHLSFLRPHPPFVVPAPYNTQHDPADMPIPLGQGRADFGAEHMLVQGFRAQSKGTDFQTEAPGAVADFTPEDFARVRALYYGMLTEVDAQLGRIFAALKASGQWENTLLIMTSDHGEMLGDHGMLGKGGFYPQSQHIPLMIRAPGSAPRRVDALTSAVDILPTICEALDSAPQTPLDGMSLVPWLRGDTPEWREAVMWEFDFRSYLPEPMRSGLGFGARECVMTVRMSDDYLYMSSPAFEPILFDLTADPDCLSNVAGQNPEARLAAAEALLTERMALTDDFMAGWPERSPHAG